jgi:hypothetical protein
VALSRSRASNTPDAILTITLLMKFKIWRSKSRQDAPRTIGPLEDKEGVNGIH